jgi:hypothetical protein
MTGLNRITICAVKANKMAEEKFLDAMVIMSNFEYGIPPTFLREQIYRAERTV